MYPTRTVLQMGPSQASQVGVELGVGEFEGTQTAEMDDFATLQDAFITIDEVRAKSYSGKSSQYPHPRSAWKLFFALFVLWCYGFLCAERA
eukprot:COSAG05_NODE_214_length_13907_cov_28.992178_22_plen_91_part_00